MGYLPAWGAHLLRSYLFIFSYCHEVLQAIILEWFAISFSSGPCFVRTLLWLIHLGLPCTEWFIASFKLYKPLCHDKPVIHETGWEVVFSCYAWSLSRVWLFAIPWIVTHQAPLSIGTLQARILEWVAMSSSRGSSQPRDWTQVSPIAHGFFTTCAPGKPKYNIIILKRKLLLWEK